MLVLIKIRPTCCRNGPFGHYFGSRTTLRRPRLAER